MIVGGNGLAGKFDFLSGVCQVKNEDAEFSILVKLIKPLKKLAEGVGFEPTVGLPLLLISSQVPLTTQPPFRRLDFI